MLLSTLGREKGRKPTKSKSTKSTCPRYRVARTAIFGRPSRITPERQNCCWRIGNGVVDWSARTVLSTLGREKDRKRTKCNTTTSTSRRFPWYDGGWRRKRLVLTDVRSNGAYERLHVIHYRALCN
jgi:hypothetical protein